MEAFKLEITVVNRCFWLRADEGEGLTGWIVKLFIIFLSLNKLYDVHILIVNIRGISYVRMCYYLQLSA